MKLFLIVMIAVLFSTVIGTVGGLLIRRIPHRFNDMILGGASWRKVFGNRRIYLICLLKMLVIPGVILLFLKYSGLAGLVPDGSTILLISLFAVITPSASTVCQLAQLYDEEPAYAGAINALTTILCVLTMPVMVYLYSF